MAKLQINWSDLEIVLDIGDFDVEVHLDTKTGEIIIKDDYISTMLNSISYDDDTTIETIISKIADEIGNPGESEQETIKHLILIERDKNERYLSLPQGDSRDGYSDMEAYIETIDDENFAEKLTVSIQGKGAFRRFKDVLLNYPDAREAWFAFEGDRKRKRASSWLKFHDIEVEFV